MDSASMKSLVLLSSFLFPAFAAAQTSNSRNCRCLYGQSCWPSAAEFDGLAAQLSQPLLRPLPEALPCYTDATSEACTSVRNSFSNSTWRAEVPGIMQNSNFEAYIYPNNTISRCPWDPPAGQTCEQGSIPPVGVDARTPQDIQQAIRFARQHNLKIVVHNTGHDLLGRSAGRGGFLIWTHQIKGITFHDAFVPQNGPRGSSLEGTFMY